MSLFNLRIKKNSQEGSRGSVMLEFALVLPILLLVVFGGIEYSRTFKYQQISSSLSREAASIAYRNCAGDSASKVPGCLKLVREKIDSYAEGISEGARVVISLYDRKPGSVTRLGVSVDGASSFASKFAVNGVKIDGISTPYVQSHSRIIVAEAFVPFDAIVPGISKIFTGVAGDFYDATIL